MSKIALFADSHVASKRFFAELRSVVRDWQSVISCLIYFRDCRAAPPKVPAWSVALGGDDAKHFGAAMTAMTPEEAVQHVVTTNPTFEVHNVDVRGVTFKAFKNIPPTVPALLAAGWAQHGNGALDYIA